MQFPRTKFTVKLVAIFAIAILFATSFIFTNFNFATAEFSSNSKRKFLVSAYYSPLPGQQFYFRGDFESEKKLNGNGTNGADGTPVFTGMIAAPRNYAFGTKISIPGLGVGAVHDRGGAIISRDEFDRIDVWMGYGEEGLARALSWGMRVLEGEIIENSATINLDFTAIAPAKISSLPRAKFSSSLKLNDRGASVGRLQNSLRELGFFNETPTNFFGPKTHAALVDFQLAFGVLPDKNSTAAGFFGPKTRQKLAEKLAEKRRANAAAREIFTRLFPQMEFEKNADENVLRLKIILRDLGFFDGEISQNFDETLCDAVLQFQLSEKIIYSEKTSGAGRFGPRTQRRLLEILSARREKIEKFEAKNAAEIFDGESKFFKKSEPLPAGNRVLLKIFEK